MNRQSKFRAAPLAGLVVFTVLAGLILWNSLGSSGDTDTTGQADRAPVLVGTADVVPVVGVHRDHGVQIGWPRSTAGATAAAVGFVRATELIAAAGPLEMRDIISVLATPGLAESLIPTTNGRLDDLMFALGARGHGANDLIWHEFPTSAQITDDREDRVTVEVWSVSIIAVSGGSVTRQIWHTETLTLVWEDDWKVEAWRSDSGPTPGLSSEVDLSTVEAVQDHAGWPTVGGGS